jgi:cytochrome c biogenesis protein CcmG/thiol:disulfide interchange protein DsbE
MSGDRLELWVKYVAGVVAFALVALAWHFGTKQSGGIVAVASRREMPKLALEQLGGGTWRMEDHRGQVVLINYWATWCGPCREETPGLGRLAREFGSKGLAVVGVSLDEGDRGKVRSFVDGFQLPYPVVFPAPMSQLEQGLEGVPTTILVDRKGRVAKTYMGAVREGDFREDVKALLEER